MNTPKPYVSMSTADTCARLSAGLTTSVVQVLIMIPGLCQVWCRKAGQPYWAELPNAPRGYTECEHLVEYYEEGWGDLYEYRITAASPLCRPVGIGK